jgi:hypothetical protein
MMDKEVVDELAAVAANKYYYGNRQVPFIELIKIDGVSIYKAYDLGMAVVEAYFMDPRKVHTSLGIYTERTNSVRFDAQATIEAIKKTAREHVQNIYGGKLEEEEARRIQIAESITSWEVLV